MSYLPPDNLPAPQPGQSEGLSPTPPPPAGPSEPAPEFRLGLQFDPQPIPDRPSRVHSRTPFHSMDLVYLLLFYFLSGRVLKLTVRASAFVFFWFSPSHLQ